MCAATLATLMLPTTPAWALLNPLLLSRAEYYADISPFTKWTPLMPRYEQQRANIGNRCIGKGCLNQQWEALLKSLKNKSTEHKVEAVNRFFNAVPYVRDDANFGIVDVWQTPYEMMSNGGDCEDYAIAKYISLKRLGVTESAMRILVVKDINLGGTIHAALEVRVGGTIKILDNQEQAVMPVASIYHYEPIFAINETRWWSYK